MATVFNCDQDASMSMDVSAGQGIDQTRGIQQATEIPLITDFGRTKDVLKDRSAPLEKDVHDIKLELEKPLYSDVLPPPLEKPLDSEVLSLPLEKPLDSELLPPPLEKPLDSEVLSLPLEKPLDSELLPQPPEKPHDSDCCGTGCVPCVFDIYEQEMKIWQKECARIQHRKTSRKDDGEDESVKLLSETDYHQFTIASVKEITSATRQYRFNLPFGRSLGLKLGQHIIIRGNVNGDVVTRQYTPISDVKVTDYFELLIKLYKDGRMSQFIQTWSPGMKIDMRGPFGEFSYKQNKHVNILMLAAGSGIAPMAQVIQGILNNEEDDTRIRLLYACRSYSDILMKSQLDEWAEFWNFSVLYVLSQEPSGVKDRYKYTDKIHLGRLDRDLLVSELETLGVSNTRVLISGTKSFDKDMLKYCGIIGLANCDIHKF
ncbi:LOW QUALITY PROTEIN: NADH-cytochrome b5 reductase-like [Argopecten irradians]|uniref:LOW QUALITY PROTEIN: NADH-cytochrome b5 reductase-like n=1 Tax=Argopecten irradians TaxID=31199 RepID=UPI0037169C34